MLRQSRLLITGQFGLVPDVQQDEILVLISGYLASYVLSWLWQAQLKPRDSSVEVRSDWEVKEEMDFPRLMKMRYMEVADPSDMWVNTQQTHRGLSGQRLHSKARRSPFLLCLKLTW